jgi:hypothetical protein
MTEVIHWKIDGRWPAGVLELASRANPRWQSENKPDKPEFASFRKKPWCSCVATP